MVRQLPRLLTFGSTCCFMALKSDGPHIQRLKRFDQSGAGSIPFKAETTGSAHADAGTGLHLHGRCGSVIDPSGYAASQT